MNKKEKRGGARPGSGRKPIKSKKASVFIYIEQDHIEAVGGRIATKDIAEQAVTKAAKKVLKIV